MVYCINHFFFLTVIIIYLRYANYEYQTVAKIEILDKAQDSEMALPTSMTVFNRSMINLDNEIGVLSSYSLHKNTVESLDFNVQFQTVGRIKTTHDHPSDWFKDYNISFKIDTDNINERLIYEIKTGTENGFSISQIVDDNIVKSFDF